MKPNAIVFGAVAAIILTAIASGPLVHAVDLTQPPEIPDQPPGKGPAAVSLVSSPDNGSIHLQKSRFGAGTYHLEGPPTIIKVGSVSGNPFVEYLIRIPALDFADIAIHSLADREDTRIRLRFRPVELSPTRISKGSYTAEIVIRLQADNYSVLREDKVSIEVAP